MLDFGPWGSNSSARFGAYWFPEPHDAKDKQNLPIQEFVGLEPTTFILEYSGKDTSTHIIR